MQLMERTAQRGLWFEELNRAATRGTEQVDRGGAFAPASIGGVPPTGSGAGAVAVAGRSIAGAARGIKRKFKVPSSSSEFRVDGDRLPNLEL